jgi:hypothetical protein
MPSWFRTLGLCLLTLAVWLAVKPAAAAAPLCDKRAATAFAPPPTLDAPVASIDVGDSSDTCSLLRLDYDTTYNQGRGSDPWPAPSHLDATVDRHVPAVLPAQVTVGAPSDTDAPYPTGIRSRLERPPRA